MAAAADRVLYLRQGWNPRRVIRRFVSPCCCAGLRLRHHTAPLAGGADALAAVMMGVAVVVAVDLANAAAWCFVRARPVVCAVPPRTG